MIQDTLKNSEKYCSIHPLFKKAFDYLNSTDLLSLPEGKTELMGSDLIVNVVNLTTKTAEVAKMEAHINYIDIQIPLNGTEFMGWIPTSKTTVIKTPYDSQKDLIFYDDKASYFLKVEPFEFAIFFPEDAHQPGIGEGTHKKIIVKVRV
jgi:YhcH/YjgK/YiaL family protein